MKNKIQELSAARAEILRLAEAVADAEVKIVQAEHRVSIAAADDGSTPAGKIVELRNAARNQLEICKIEGNRAAAKLAEAESNFADLVKELVDPVLSILSQKAAAAEMELRQQIAPLVGEHAAKTHFFTGLIKIAAPVDSISRAARNLHTSNLLSSGVDGVREDLVTNLLAAVPFID